MRVRVVDEASIRELVTPAVALEAVRKVMAELARGNVTLPAASDLDLPDGVGEMHVKGAYVHGQPYFSYKAASGFYGNVAKGLPVSSGLNLVFSAATGILEFLLMDNGYLTEIRTGAAGALAADLLAVDGPVTVGVLGAGGQARYQLEALAGVRDLERVVVFSRTRDKAERYAEEMCERLRLPVDVASTGREAVEGVDVVVTTTPARDPIVRAEWIGPGTHITAMGADLPAKQEIDPAVFAKADIVSADDVDHASNSGELHHAITAGAIERKAVTSIGELELGSVRGRQSKDDVTIADLTGLGVQDAAVANAAVVAALARDVGRELTS